MSLLKQERVFQYPKDIPCYLNAEGKQYNNLQQIKTWKKIAYQETYQNDFEELLKSGRKRRSWTVIFHKLKCKI